MQRAVGAIAQAGKGKRPAVVEMTRKHEESEGRSLMPRKKRSGNSKRPAGQAIEIPEELALEVWESLKEKDVVEMLKVSKPSIELCHAGQHRKVSQERKRNGEPRSASHAFMEFVERRTEWLRSDPVYAMEVFLTCRRAGFRPPEWALKWIEDAFRKWCDAQGNSSLDCIMGLNGRGKRRAFKAAERRANSLKLFVDVAKLVALGATVREAAYMVCCLQNPAGCASDDPSESDRLEKKADTLAQKYVRYPARTELKRYYDALLAHPGVWKVSEYIATFPRASVAPKLRPFLKL
jgi:hypothetical protein